MKLQVYALIFFRINSFKKAHYLKKLVTFYVKIFDKTLNYFSVNISDVIKIHYSRCETQKIL